MQSNLRSGRRATGRLRRSQQEIEGILRRHRLSGLSLLAFAQEQDLCYATLLRWRRRADAMDGEETSKAASPVPVPAFIPIELAPSPAGVEFVLNWASDRCLRIPSGFDPGELRRLLEVLGVRP
ncbi:MAG: hypothetical protein J0L84_15960 [Verrucomicrobia bacterium]|nr:hypothetical protein [Verrucomicrobiota bacterium]